MIIRQFVVDAFASKLFSGNPAAVCPLPQWLDDEVMQAIAAENNLSETAFFVACDNGFALRWFTPVNEVDLCGHATLAAAHVIFNHLQYAAGEICFHTRSGELLVKKNGVMLEMVFPASVPQVCDMPEALIKGLGATPLAVLAAEDYLAVFPDEASIKALTPDFNLLKQLPLRGVIVTAPGLQHDFVSRFFAPKYGINEDPVTGSAHCQLAPYWAGQTGKKEFNAAQVSIRFGEVYCRVAGNKVILSGKAITFMQGELLLDT